MRIWKTLAYLSFPCRKGVSILASGCSRKRRNPDLESVELDEQNQELPVNDVQINCDNSSTGSNKSDGSYEEIEINENQVAWSCVTCTEFNLQQKVPKRSKSTIEQSRGTKENAFFLQIIPRQLGDMEDEYVAEFRQIPYTGNKCCKCGTPFDYRPRRSLKKYFHPLRDYSLEAKKREFYEERQRMLENTAGNKDEEMKSPSLPLSLLHGANFEEAGLPVTAEFNGSDEDSDGSTKGSDKQISVASLLLKLTKTLQLLLISIPRLAFRVHSHLVERHEPPESERYLPYNDSEREELLKTFLTPASMLHNQMDEIVNMEEEKRGEYNEGEAVEALVESGARHQNIWYPGKIVRATLLDDNGKYYYDVLYQNGELAECIPADRIRRLVSYDVSPLLRLMMCLLLICLVLCPLSIAMPLINEERFAASYSSSDASTGTDDENGNNKKSPFLPGKVLPCDDALSIILWSSIIMASGILCARIRSYLDLARIGILHHLKLLVFSSLPTWALLITIVMIRRTFMATVVPMISDENMTQKNDSSHQPTTLWRKCLISSTLFSMASIFHLLLVSPFWGLAGIIVTIPLLIFQILNALSLDGVVVFSSQFVVYAHLQFMVVLLLIVRLFIPYVRKSYLYV